MRIKTQDAPKYAPIFISRRLCLFLLDRVFQRNKICFFHKIFFNIFVTDVISCLFTQIIKKISNVWVASPYQEHCDTQLLVRLFDVHMSC